MWKKDLIKEIKKIFNQKKRFLENKKGAIRLVDTLDSKQFNEKEKIANQFGTMLILDLFHEINDILQKKMGNKKYLNIKGEGKIPRKLVKGYVVRAFYDQWVKENKIKEELVEPAWKDLVDFYCKGNKNPHFFPPPLEPKY